MGDPAQALSGSTRSQVPARAPRQPYQGLKGGDGSEAAPVGGPAPRRGAGAGHGLVARLPRTGVGRRGDPRPPAHHGRSPSGAGGADRRPGPAWRTARRARWPAWPRCGRCPSPRPGYLQKW